jgi:aspartate-semialdehyde dehydrogenase
MQIGIVGATGIVGSELLKLLVAYELTDIRVCASDASINKNICYDKYEYTLQKLDREFFLDLDVVFFCAENDISAKWIKYVLEDDTFTKMYIIDNSSEFRMNDDIPLIVPEINYSQISSNKLIANPNCTAAMLCMVLYPLLKLSTIKRVDVSTYQAVSGAGKGGIAELETQMEQYVKCEDIVKSTFKSQILNNCFSHNSSIDMETGYNGEEIKIIKETLKILQPMSKDMEISATCVRVPVMRAHCESIKVVFENEVTEEDIRKVLSESNGVTIIDDRVNNIFPEPLFVSGKTDVFVGRIRKDYFDNKKTLHLFICGDQLLKGAAYNAFQIFKGIFSL